MQNLYMKRPSNSIRYDILKTVRNSTHKRPKTQTCCIINIRIDHTFHICNISVLQNRGFLQNMQFMRFCINNDNSYRSQTEVYTCSWLSMSLFVYLCMYACLSLCVSVSVCLSRSLSLLLFFSVSVCLSLYLSVSLSLSRLAHTVDMWARISLGGSTVRATLSLGPYCVYVGQAESWPTIYLCGPSWSLGPYRSYVGQAESWPILCMCGPG